MTPWCRSNLIKFVLPTLDITVDHNPIKWWRKDSQGLLYLTLSYAETNFRLLGWLFPILTNSQSQIAGFRRLLVFAHMCTHSTHWDTDIYEISGCSVIHLWHSTCWHSDHSRQDPHDAKHSHWESGGTQRPKKGAANSTAQDSPFVLFFLSSSSRRSMLCLLLASLFHLALCNGHIMRILIFKLSFVRNHSKTYG